MHSVAVAAPQRSTYQRMAALERANDVRSKRAKLKDAVKMKNEELVPLVEDPPDYLKTMKVHDLLLAIPKVGSVKVNKMLYMLRISPAKTIGGLSPRQRMELVILLKRMS